MLLLGSNAFAQSADFAAIDRFWQVHDVLEADREPTQVQWDDLFECAGLAALEERERKRKILTTAYRLAFKPALRDSFERVVQGDGYLAYILPHLSRIPALRTELTKFQEELASADLLSQARRSAQSLLPDGLTARHPPPSIAMVFFAPDGRGYPAILIADLLNLMESRSRTGFFAHELHHYYRNRVATLGGDFGDDDYYLMYVLINLEEEGIADQLDKAEIPAMSDSALRRDVPNPSRREFFEAYRRHFSEAVEWLERIERVLEHVAEDSSVAAELGEELHGELPIGGRPIGAFMAATIVRVLGRERLVEVVGNPFAFWRLYNEAAGAMEADAHVLSAKAMRTVTALEAKYGK